MTHQNAQAAYKLILVPVECIQGTIPAAAPPSVRPEYVKVTDHVPYEVAADVGPDKRITMTRVFFDENVEVIG